MPSKKKARRRGPPRGMLHIDKRAAGLASVQGSDDDLLDTAQMAQWFGVSTQWLEGKRHIGGGPPFERLGPRKIRYRRGKAKRWLDQRTHLRTSEYAK